MLDTKLYKLAIEAGFDNNGVKIVVKDTSSLLDKVFCNNSYSVIDDKLNKFADLLFKDFMQQLNEAIKLEENND